MKFNKDSRVDSKKAFLQSLDWPDFEPHRLAPTGFVQTVASTVWPHKPDRMARKTHDITLDDGDVIRVVENRSPQWKPGDRIVFAVHGLSGTHRSPYMTRIAHRFYDHGMLVIRINLRGCGIGGGLARNPYHSGRSEDTRTVLRWLKKEFPDSPVVQIGYSLGANITLKMAGEDGDQPAGNLDKIVAISPPVNLAKTAVHLVHHRNLFFDQFFVWKLKSEIRKINSDFPDVKIPEWPLRMNLTDIDELYTAPRSGFTDAADYYQKSSAAPIVEKIGIPGLILCSYDDPVIDSKSVAELKHPSFVNVVMTDKGGHVGFIGKPRKNQDSFWMDGLIERYVLSQASAK